MRARVEYHRFTTAARSQVTTAAAAANLTDATTATLAGLDAKRCGSGLLANIRSCYAADIASEADEATRAAISEALAKAELLGKDAVVAAIDRERGARRISVWLDGLPPDEGAEEVDCG